MKDIRLPPRRVWYLHHAESESVIKTHNKKLAIKCCDKDGCDMIRSETYYILLVEYGQADI